MRLHNIGIGHNQGERRGDESFFGNPETRLWRFCRTKGRRHSIANVPPLLEDFRALSQLAADNRNVVSLRTKFDTNQIVISDHSQPPEQSRPVEGWLRNLGR